MAGHYPGTFSAGLDASKESIAEPASPELTPGAFPSDGDLENGRGRRTKMSSTTSFTSSTDSDDSEDRYNDGHRPTRREMRLSRSRSRRSYEERLSRATGSSPTSNRTASYRGSTISRIRTRTRVKPFAHPLAKVKTGSDVLVDFEGPDDPYRPMNWPLGKKVYTTLLYGFITMSATWASASYSAGTELVAKEFSVGYQVSVLGTSLFLIGFGLGPLVWAPLSEVYGRRVAVLSPMFVAICFSFASATAKDFQTLILTRFFGAFFASAPVTNTGGVMGDLYPPDYRAIAIAGYALAVVGGPSLGPIVSAAVAVQPGLGWRWTQYLTGILQAVTLLIGLIFIDETYPPKLLVAKASQLRHETGNWALHAKFEEWNVTIGDLAQKFLLRPIQLLCTPICFLIALYASFCYGILYMQLGGIPFIFREIRGWNQVPATLPFLCIMIGAFLGAIANTYNQILYNKAYHAAGDRAIPEKRLPPMMVGGFLFSGGQFLMGFTAQPNHHWVLPCLGILMTGTGFFMIFQAALNYLVDTFTQYSASAVGANTFLRSCFGAAFPLVVRPMYTNIGVNYGSCVTGGFAALLIPVPWAFYVYGKQIRRRGKWSRDSVWD